MGNCLSCAVGGGAWSLWRRAPNREITLLLLGLDGAGKSTVLANLIGEDTEDVTPTIGFANAATTLGSSHVTLYDVGGGPRIRGIWKNYYAQSHGIIFVVDASSPVRLDEAKQVLSGMLQEECVTGKPLLIFANKQDQEGALSEDEIRARLELDTLLGEHRHHGRVVGCTGLSSAGGGLCAKVVTGVEWVVGEVRGRWEEVGERVRSDGERQWELQERERAERRERVRRIREERERLAALQRSEDGDQQPVQNSEEEDRGIPANPFKPISQVVAEATEREAKAKRQKTVTAAQKKSGPREKGPEEKGEGSKGPAEKGEGGKGPEEKEEGGERSGEEGGGEKVEASSTSGQQTAPVPTDNQTRVGSGGTSGDAKGAGSLTPSQRSEAASSGLSDSTDTLTQVTATSKDGSLLSESLGPVTTPTTQSVAMATTQQQTVRVRPRDYPSSIQQGGVGSSDSRVPKKGKLSFLSRLKSRNKIVPSTQPLSVTTSAEPPTPAPSLHPPPSLNTWLTPLTNVHTTEQLVAEKAGGGREGEVLVVGNNGRGVMMDPYQGLPELPKNQRTLPPLRVNKRPPGLQEQTFTTAEDVSVSPTDLPPLTQTVTS